MIEFLVSAAGNPITPIVVLTCAGLIILVEAWKASPRALMGDFFTDGFDE